MGAGAAAYEVARRFREIYGGRDSMLPLEQVLEGTWEEVSRHGPQLAGKRVRLTVLPDEEQAEVRDVQPRPRSYGFFYGVFSGEPQPTNDDFKSAEFQGDADD